MPAVLTFIRALFRFDRNMTTEHPDAHARDARGAFDSRRPLYIGRGIVCLGGTPRSSERKHPRN